MIAKKHTPWSRGLTVLESVSLATRPLRFSELRELTPGIPDSTLSRLLKSLETSGHLTRLSDVGYVSGPETRSWLAAVRRSSRSFQDVAVETIQTLTSTSQESAGIALLGGESIQIVKSQTVSGAISILGDGELLHFESDHAASLAILHRLSRANLSKALKSSYSRIQTKTEYVEAIEATHRADGVWLDRSRERPGICRMALGFSHAGRPGAVFLCLTLESARHRYEALANALRSAQGTLQNIV